MGVEQTKAVRDHAVAFNVALTTLAVLTAAATFAISLIPPGTWLVGIRILAGCLAVATAVVGLFKFRNERAFKRQQEEERVSLDQALKAESRRTSLLINGAMLGTADKLRRISVLNQASKDVEVSGFRTSIVSKVCDLVQSEAPRAAYFRVQDLSAQSRVMRSGTYSDSRNREDSFTSEFVEGYGGDQGVWNLIDSGDVEVSNDTDAAVPATWDGCAWIITSRYSRPNPGRCPGRPHWPRPRPAGCSRNRIKAIGMQPDPRAATPREPAP